jgi:hypothetical protein
MSASGDHSLIHENARHIHSILQLSGFAEGMPSVDYFVRGFAV